MFLRSILVCILILAVTGIASAAVSDFDDLSLPQDSYWNGSDESGGFTSGDAYYVNNCIPSWGYWDGWAYSNMSDTTTPGYGNQYSAYTGGAQSGNIYSVAFDGLSIGMGPAPAMELTGSAYGTTLSGAYFTNTTYAALSMRDGDGYAKQFGGPSGDDSDWFLLTIMGIDVNGVYSGIVEFYLADYRFTDDYIIDEWTWVDLSGLGDVVGLEFYLSSSDNNAGGMKTPGYFAMDTVIPEPASIILLGAGLLLLRNKKQIN